MTEVKWIKIITNIFNDEKIQLIESMPDSDTILIIWFKLLALAGKSNSGGLVMFNENVPYTTEMLVTLFRRKESVIQLALQTFERFKMIEILDNDAILISNWEKHQSIDKLEVIREKNRKRVALHREKIRQIENNVTLQKHYSNTDVTQENKNKNKKENKDIKEKDKKEKTVAKRSPSFVKPTREEIFNYCNERKNQVNPSQFYDFYESKNWMVGKNKMKDWKAAVRTWEQRNKSNGIKISTRPDVKPDWLEEYIQENGGN
jgi:predicted phage replisome organizer